MDLEQSIFGEIAEHLNHDGKMTEKQLKILEAAIKLISEKGYYNTSTSEIAKLAGVAEGTIFRHYPTKKDLLVSIVKPVILKISAPFFAKQFVDQVFNTSYPTFRELLYAFIKNRYHFAKENVPLLKILFQELAFHPEIQSVFRNIFMEKIIPAYNHVLDYYKEKGDLKALPNETIIRMTVPTILGLIMTRFLINPDIPWDDELEIERTVAFIMDGIGSAAGGD